MSNYFPQAQKLLPILQKLQHKLNFDGSYQRLNWTADDVNAVCDLNMKTRLRLGINRLC